MSNPTSLAPEFSLRQGRNMLAIPGPSMVPEAVLAAMGRPVTNIYDGEVVDLCWGLVADLPAVVRTEGEGFLAIANGHGGWEMALTNTTSRGDKVVVVNSGNFGVAWADNCTRLGLDVELLGGPSPREPFDVSLLADRLAADTAHEIKGVLLCHVDTASGIRNDPALIRAALDAADHPALFYIDGVASVGCEHFEMDALGVDVVVGASQKGLMMPPGLAFVWASPKAIDARERADLVTPYWDWTPRRSGGPHYLLFSGTPPVSHLHAARVALDMLLTEGMDHVWWRHRILADAVRAAVTAWGEGGGIEFRATDPATRSNAITALLTSDIDALALRERCQDGANLTLGIGMEANPEDAFRIGHMGHLNPPMILGTLATIEAALLSLGHSLPTSGIAAASQVIATALTPPTA